MKTTTVRPTEAQRGASSDTGQNTSVLSPFFIFVLINIWLYYVKGASWSSLWTPHTVTALQPWAKKTVSWLLCPAFMIKSMSLMSFYWLLCLFLLYIMLLLKMSFCAAPGVPHSANSSEFRRQKSNSVSILLKKRGKTRGSAVLVFPRWYILFDFTPSPSGEVADCRNGTSVTAQDGNQPV